MNDMVKGSVGVAVFFVLLGALVLPNFAEVQDEVVTTYEDVTTESEWKDAVDDTTSTDYTISGDNLTLTGDTGSVQTYSVDTESHDTFRVDVDNEASDTNVTVYDGQDNAVTTETLSGDSNTTLTVQNYTADSYYLQLEATTTTDAVVDSYSVEGADNISSDVNVLIYLVLVLFLVGIGLGMFAKYN